MQQSDDFTFMLSLASLQKLNQVFHSMTVEFFNFVILVNSLELPIHKIMPSEKRQVYFILFLKKKMYSLGNQSYSEKGRKEMAARAKESSIYLVHSADGCTGQHCPG